jgi:hypothetical protein
MRVITTLSNGAKKDLGDGFQKSGIYRNFLHFCSALSICLFIGLVLLSQPVHAAPLDSAVTATSPHDGAQYVSVDSPITITFNNNNDDITASTDITKFTLTNTTNNTPVTIKTPTVSGNTLTITPTQNLAFDCQYELDIAQDGVTDKVTNAAFLTQTNKLKFSTDSYSFTELMINSGPKIEEWLNTDGYTPRDIKLFAPTRYINGVDVLHKNNSSVTTNSADAASGAVTNFDITTDSRIKSVQVVINNGTPREAKLLQTSGSTSVFTAGFASEPSSFDFTVNAYLDSGATQLADSQTEAFAQSTKPIVEFKKSYYYRTSGKSFTLYDLMRSLPNFQNLLTENTTDEIKAQVVASVAQ